MKNVISPLEAATSLTEFWSPRIIEELDDSYVKVAKLKGTLAWHSHDDEDELFLVLKGQLRIEFENGHIDLQEGDLHVVPKDTMHNPVAHEECLVMLIEHKGTAHTGDSENSVGRSIDEQLGSFVNENS